MYLSYAASGMTGLIVVGVVALAILMTVAWCRLFHKAGIPWGFYFIPVYGTYLTYSIADCGGLFWANLIIGVLSSLLTGVLGYSALGVLAFLIVIISLILQIVYCKNMALCFGKSGGFAVGLFFLFPIFFLVLAFGSARHYNKPGYTGHTVTSNWTCDCGTVNASSRITCLHCGAQKK